jgi:hypothetical protein
MAHLTLIEAIALDIIRTIRKVQHVRTVGES